MRVERKNLVMRVKKESFVKRVERQSYYMGRKGQAAVEMEHVKV